MILAERAARLAAETKLAEAANAQAELSNTEALIAHLKLEIEKLRRTLYGSRSERSARLHVRRLRSRCRQSRGHVHPHHDGPPQ